MSTAVFGAPEWRARSGRTIKPLEDGTITFQGSHGYLAPLTAMDAEEFFQAKRDLDLGRWRWPENPHYVVYQADAGYVYVIDELTGNSTHAHRQEGYSGSGHGTIFNAAAAFFEAHPERKPWEDAKDGEIWEFSLGCSSGQYLADSGRFFHLPLRAPSHPGWKPASFPSDFEHGERIWPEDAS